MWFSFFRKISNDGFKSVKNLKAFNMMICLGELKQTIQIYHNFKYSKFDVFIIIIK